MTTVTKEQILKSVDKLPPNLLKEAWLFLESLSFKSISTYPAKEKALNDPDGAFPELDISIEAIESILINDWQRREARLLVDG